MIGLTKLITQRESPSDRLRYGDVDGKTKTHKFEDNGVYRPVVVFNIASACNLACQHCYYSARYQPLPDELSTQEIFGVIDDLSDFQVPVVLVSGGEPLMKKDIFTILEYFNFKGIETALSTNGTLIKPWNIDKIKKSGVGYVGISIDGPENIHDNFRGKKGAFRMASEAIDICIENNIRTSVRLTLTKQNKDYLFDIIDWAEEKKVNRFCIYHLVATGRGKDIKDATLTPEETREIIKKVIEKAEKLQMEILTVDNPADGIFILAELIRRGEIEKAKKVFKMLKSQKGDGTGKRIAVIAHNGNVHLSQFWLTEKIGNVREEKFSRIWNDNSNPILKYLREKVREELEGKCGICPVKNLCGGFRPRAYAYTGKINSSDPLCYINQDDMKTITEFIRREIGEGEEEKGIEEEKLLQEERAN